MDGTDGLPAHAGATEGPLRRERSTGTNTKQDREARGKDRVGAPVEERQGKGSRILAPPPAHDWAKRKCAAAEQPYPPLRHRVRAEPVSLLFEKQRVVMQPGMNALQEEMLSFSRDDGGLGS